MRSTLIVTFAAIVAISLAQSSLDSRGRQSGDSLSDVRLLVQGKFGRSENQLDQDFQGFVTNVNYGNVEMSHVVAQLRKPQDSSSSSAGAPSASAEQQQGKVIHIWSFLDHNKGTSTSYSLVQASANEVPTCYVINSAGNANLGTWEQLSQEPCGPGRNGTVYTRRSSLTDDHSQTYDSEYSVCVVGGDVAQITGISKSNNQIDDVVQAEVLQSLPKPDAADLATMVEFSIPFPCLVDPQPYNAVSFNRDIATV